MGSKCRFSSLKFRLESTRDEMLCNNLLFRIIPNACSNIQINNLHKYIFKFQYMNIQGIELRFRGDYEAGH